MMKIAYHGGRCCGIKTIYNLSVGAYKEPALEAAGKYEDTQRSGRNPSSFSTSVFVGDAPEESNKERLTRLVEYIKANQFQKAGLLEVVTYEYKYAILKQTDFYKEQLEELGFKAVTRFYNGNSNNYCTVWHYAYGQPAI